MQDLFAKYIDLLTKSLESTCREHPLRAIVKDHCVQGHSKSTTVARPLREHDSAVITTPREVGEIGRARNRWELPRQRMRLDHTTCAVTTKAFCPASIQRRSIPLGENCQKLHLHRPTPSRSLVEIDVRDQDLGRIWQGWTCVFMDWTNPEKHRYSERGLSFV